MTKVCTSCTTSNTDNAKYCTSCGQDISSIKPIAKAQAHQSTNNNCLWCNSNAGFRTEEGRFDSKWGMTSHKVKIFICRNCGFNHIFDQGRSIFDFD